MTNWTAEYDNRAAVPESVEIIENWAVSASAFRASPPMEAIVQLDWKYGTGERNELDFFAPKANTVGTVIFIHGGYWRMLDKSSFSHLAAGPLGANWSCAIPSYTLAPQARIGEIAVEVATAIDWVAKEVDGPIRLIGHSAGGHLVSRMLCDDGLLTDSAYRRIENTVAVSGLFDLENLQHAAMNEDLQLDRHQVLQESPALLEPRKSARITCLVGGDEKPEFLRQNTLLNGWKEKGARVEICTDDGKNHFTVIESLADTDSFLTRTLMA